MRLLPSKSKVSAEKHAGASNVLQEEHARLRREIAQYAQESSKFIRLLNEMKAEYEQKKTDVQKDLVAYLDEMERHKRTASNELADAQKRLDELEESFDAKRYRELNIMLEKRLSDLDEREHFLSDLRANIDGKQTSVAISLKELEEREAGLLQEKEHFAAVKNAFERKQVEQMELHKAAEQRLEERSQALGLVDAQVQSRLAEVKAVEKTNEIERKNIKLERSKLELDRIALQDAYRELEKSHKRILGKK